MKHKILIADDEANLRMLVRMTLDDESYELIEAADGQQALELARSEKPDLLLLDWSMPFLQGVEVVEQLRSEDCSSPIIMLSARGQQIDIRDGLRAGVNAYLVKPFSPSELLEQVKLLLTPAKAAQ